MNDDNDATWPPPGIDADAVQRAATDAAWEEKAAELDAKLDEYLDAMRKNRFDDKTNGNRMMLMTLVHSQDPNPELLRLLLPAVCRAYEADRARRQPSVLTPVPVWRRVWRALREPA